MTPSGQHTVAIPAGTLSLPALLGLPARPRGLVIVAHGSGSGHLSPRNNAVARGLHEAGLATLLADLLSPTEAQDRPRVFDLDLLADRLLACTAWVRAQPHLRPLTVGYFGASTGAGAALLAAARQPAQVDAVVSRGGRPDLAGPALQRVSAPTLLIVGGNERTVLDLNVQALSHLRSIRDLAIVPGAGHLFAEPGALQRVTRLARDWFLRYASRPISAAR